MVTTHSSHTAQVALPCLPGSGQQQHPPISLPILDQGCKIVFTPQIPLKLHKSTLAEDPQCCSPHFSCRTSFFNASHGDGVTSSQQTSFPECCVWDLQTCSILHWLLMSVRYKEREAGSDCSQKKGESSEGKVTITGWRYFTHRSSPLKFLVLGCCGG